MQKISPSVVPSKFLSLPSPKLSPTQNGKWRLLEEYRFNGHAIPAGFITDLDSVPRVPLAYDVFKNRTRLAALAHDWLYSIGANRSESDRAFLRLMIAEGVPLRYALPIWAAVRAFGWLVYRKKKFYIAT